MNKQKDVKGSIPLERLAHIDAESLSEATSQNFKFKYIDISCAANGKLNLPSSFVDFANAPSRARKVLRDGDVIISTVRPNLKAFAYCRLDDGPYVASTGFAVLRAKPSVDPYFLLSALLSDDLSKQIESYAVGSNYPAINSSDVRRLQIPEFSSRQQRAIGITIAAVDLIIEKTEALIEKYQQIKAGLMHDLFTRGVLPDGKLRPTREQAPELYRETGIGFLPKEWTVEKLENLLAPVAHNMRSGPFGSALLKHELVENGIPFLGIDNVHVERFVPDFKRFVSRRKFEQLAKYKVRPGDVVITIMGTVGRCCVIPSTLVEALSSKHLWTMTFDEEKVIPELVCWQLNHAAWAQAWFRRAMQGGIMDAIQSKTLKTLMLPLPSPEEQKLIHGRYGVISRRISTAVEQLDKLRLEKNGLMHDLLTGKVAVKVDATEEEHA